MISSRYAPAVCVLLGLALVPTFIHSYADSRVADGRRTSVIPASLAGYTSRPSGRNATWGQRRFDSHDWMERTYTTDTDEVKLTVVRSYDLKSLYHHPELAVAYGTSFVRSEVTRFAERPSIPVHALYSDSGAVAMYVLHYDDQFVADPVLFQLRTAGELLFSGRQPMTLFFVTDASAATADIGQLPAAKLLLAAVNGFVAGPQRAS